MVNAVVIYACMYVTKYKESCGIEDRRLLKNPAFDIKGINSILKYSKIENSYDNLTEYFTMFLTVFLMQPYKYCLINTNFWTIIFEWLV